MHPMVRIHAKLEESIWLEHLILVKRLGSIIQRKFLVLLWILIYQPNTIPRIQSKNILHQQRTHLDYSVWPLILDPNNQCLLFASNKIVSAVELDTIIYHSAHQIGMWSYRNMDWKRNGKKNDKNYNKIMTNVPMEIGVLFRFDSYPC